MTFYWGLLITVIMFVVSVVVGDLVSEEIRTRLDRLPYGLLRLAVRKMPPDAQNEYLKEWTGELYVFLRGAEAMPVTRLWRGLRYAFGLLHARRAIAREAGLDVVKSWLSELASRTRDLGESMGTLVIGPLMFGFPLASAGVGLYGLLNRNTAILEAVSVTVELVVFALTIFSGFRYITSAGDSSIVAGARNAMIYANVLSFLAVTPLIIVFLLT